MAVHSLAPWLRRDVADESGAHPLHTVQQEIDHIFDNFFRGFALSPVVKETSAGQWLAPRMDIAETEQAYKISAELPGVVEKDIDLSLANGVLTLRGEKKTESKDEGKNYHRVERSYGSFQRSIALPEEIQEDKIQADFKDGVLEITIPKSAKAEKTARKISVTKK